MSGVFITMEGGEGVGKSTNLAFVGECLTAAGKAVRMTRDPGGPALGERIRAILLDRGAEGMGVDAELLLMFAARPRRRTRRRARAFRARAARVFRASADGIFGAGPARARAISADRRLVPPPRGAGAAASGIK